MKPRPFSHHDPATVEEALLAVQADGARVETGEGLAPDPEHLNLLQAEFARHHGVQRGFCTGGASCR